MSDQNQYLGNPNLKKTNTVVEFTKDDIKEYHKCAQDPLYFIENYVQIVSLDEGLVPFEMYDFQRGMVSTMHDNRFSIFKLPRQSGKSTTSSVIFCTMHCSIKMSTLLFLQTNRQLQEIF